MVKGPSLLGANLGLMSCCLRFLASNQTLSHLEKEVKHWQVCEAITCLASLSFEISDFQPNFISFGEGSEILMGT